jgi:KUP system potassium uptake protein
LLATVATVITSQAVITGAFSMTSHAIQLGLLPRLRVIPTSDLSAQGELAADDRDAKPRD